PHPGWNEEVTTKALIRTPVTVGRRHSITDHPVGVVDGLGRPPADLVGPVATGMQTPPVEVETRPDAQRDDANVALALDEEAIATGGGKHLIALESRVDLPAPPARLSQRA